MDKIEKILNQLNTTDYDEVFENIDEEFEKQKMNITKYLSGIIGYRFGTDITKIETYSFKDAYTDHCDFNTLESLGGLSEDTTLSSFLNEYTGDELKEYSSWNRKHFETYYETLDDNWNEISDFFVFYEVRKHLKTLKIELTEEEFKKLCAELYNDFYRDYIDDSPFFEFEKEIYDLPYNDFVKLGEKERKIMERNNKEYTFEEMNEKLKYIKD